MSQIQKLEKIFAIPINAIINADFNAAETSSKYIKKFGFTSNTSKNIDGSDLGTLKETSFIYDSIGNDGKLEKRLIRIPSLSLIPLPLLHVDHADFDFSVRVVDSDEIIEEGKVNALLTPQQSNKQKNPNAPQLDANINVKMKVVQSDIPAGISNLLALMGSNTLNKALGKIKLENPLLKFSSKTDNYSTFLQLMDSSGVPIKNAPIKASYDDASGIILNCNKKRWENGHSMLTNDNGKIYYQIKYNSEDENTGTIHNIEFIHEKYITVIQKYYME
ncbi:MAG: DUF2589 domain-containing protein [Fibrobacter sp.]|nr:DUF2589 domain-containing protein [Fibrobacter sp.]